MPILTSKYMLHGWQVTHHEYEVETSNGRTITKRRKTRSTVMFEVCNGPSGSTIKPKNIFQQNAFVCKQIGF